MTVTLPKPERRERLGEYRNVNISYPTGKHDAEGWELFCVLSTRHDKAGMNYFNGTRHNNRYSASLCVEGHKDGMVRFTMFSGLGIMAEDTTRYNKAKFLDFTRRAQEKFESLVAEGNEQVIAYVRAEKAAQSV